jgi:hypothetical protein
MTVIVPGVYGHGKIELLEAPPGIQEGPVRVVLIQEPNPKPPPSPLTFGKYRTGTLSTPEDFQEAEWRGEAEFDNLHGR